MPSASEANKPEIILLCNGWSKHQTIMIGTHDMIWQMVTKGDRKQRGLQHIQKVSELVGGLSNVLIIICS